MWYPSRGHNSGPIFIPFPGLFFPLCPKRKKLFFSVSHFVSNIIVPLGDLSPYKKILILRIPLLQLPSLPWWFPGGLSSLDSGFGLFWPLQNKMKSCAFFCPRFLFWQIRVPAPWAPQALSTCTASLWRPPVVCPPLHLGILHAFGLHSCIHDFVAQIEKCKRFWHNCRALLILSRCSVAFSVFFPRLWWVFGLSSVTLLSLPHIILLCVNVLSKKYKLCMLALPLVFFGFLSKCALNASSATTCILQLPKSSHAWALNKTGFNVASDLHLCTYILSSRTQNLA